MGGVMMFFDRAMYVFLPFYTPTFADMIQARNGKCTPILLQTSFNSHLNHNPL